MKDGVTPVEQYLTISPDFYVLCMINLQSVSVVLGVDPFSVNVSPPPLEHTEERKSSSLFVEQ